MNLYSHFEIAFIYAKHITLDIKLLFASDQTKNSLAIKTVFHSIYSSISVMDYLTSVATKILRVSQMPVFSL